VILVLPVLLVSAEPLVQQVRRALQESLALQGRLEILDLLGISGLRVIPA
jgi:hypothetical protein